MSLIALIIDLFILFLGKPPFIATSLVDYFWEFSGVLFISAALWWLLTFFSLGLAIWIHPIVGAFFFAIALVMWGLKILTPLGSMTLALYHPMFAWSILEGFYLIILLVIDLVLLKVFGKS